MSKYPVTIFLPAAGLGERLRPVTNHLPKPLLPILGKPIIERILERLDRGLQRRHRHQPALEGRPDPAVGCGYAMEGPHHVLPGGPHPRHRRRAQERGLPSVEGPLHRSQLRHPARYRLHQADRGAPLLGQPGDPRLPPAAPSQQRRDRQERPAAGCGERRAVQAGSRRMLPTRWPTPALPSTIPPSSTSFRPACPMPRSPGSPRPRPATRCGPWTSPGSYWNDVGNPVTYSAGRARRAPGQRRDGLHLAVGPVPTEIEIDGYVVLERGPRSGPARASGTASSCRVPSCPEPRRPYPRAGLRDRAHGSGHAAVAPRRREEAGRAGAIRSFPATSGCPTMHPRRTNLSGATRS